jgi:UDP-N-acetylglucosamine 2-epimerase (non-hydrolysing)
MLKVMTIVGTRPEIIRLSRVMARLDHIFDHKIVHTGQNYDFELNQVFFDELGIRKPDYFLGAAGSTAAATIAKVIELVDQVLATENPDAVLILGDTNSCLSVIAAKKRHIPIFHMEAGNRCFDSRVPEEVNRKIVDHISDINLAYTEHARRNLLSEGLPADQIFITGSPMAEIIQHHQQGIQNSSVLSSLKLEKDKYLVASFHREENVDDKNRLRQIVTSLNLIATTYNLPIILSTHPRTKKRLSNLGIELHPLIREMKPFGFFDYLRLQQDSFCTISDSGTITEESAIVGFPAITARDTHERPEGMDVGVLVMTGINAQNMLDGIAVSRQHLEDQAVRNVPASYQDIDVSWRVAKLIQSYTEYINRKTWHKSRSE